MSDKLFSQKIKYLYKKLNISNKEFIKIFWDGNKKSFANRNKTILNSWLDKGITQVKGFYFDEYPIAKWKIDNNIPAFTKESFMYSSFEDFKKEVDKYIVYKLKPRQDFEYKYIYFYDINLKKIIYNTINIIEKINDNYYIVELQHYDFYFVNGFQIYKGTLKIDKGYYHILVENNFETLSIYSMLNKGYTANKTINGISLGLSYQDGIPIAYKVLLTKDKLLSKEKDLLYLSSNKMEIIEANNIIEVLQNK